MNSTKNRDIGLPFLVFLATVFAVFMMVARTGPGVVVDGISMDADTQTRIAFLSWSLDHGGIRNYWFPRIGAPLGMQLHWTLPFDFLACLLAWVPARFEGWSLALAQVGFVLGPLMFAADCAAVAWLTCALGHRQASPWSAMMPVISYGLASYGAVGRLTHHDASVALATAAVASAVFMARRRRAGFGVATAVLSVLAVWTSVETIPAVLVAWTVVLVANALRPTSDEAVARYCAALVLLSAVPIVLDPEPNGVLWLSSDRFGLLHTALFVVLAACAHATRWMRGVPALGFRLCRMGCFYAPPLSLLACVAYVRAPPALISDPLVAVHVHGVVSELSPAWSNPFFFVAAMVPASLLPWVAMHGWLRRKGRPSRIVWLVFLLLGLCVFALGLLHMRLTSYGTCLAAPFCGILIEKRMKKTDAKSRRPDNAAITALFLGIAILLILPSTFLTLARTFSPHRIDAHDDCVLHSAQARALEDSLPGEAVVLSPLWMTPQLLARTRLRTVGGAYHRDQAGMDDVLVAFTGNDGAVKAVIARRQVSAILMCDAYPDIKDERLYGKDSFAYRLTHNQVPDWLERVPAVNSDGFSLYRIKSGDIHASR